MFQREFVDWALLLVARWRWCSWSTLTSVVHVAVHGTLAAVRTGLTARWRDAPGGRSVVPCTGSLRTSTSRHSSSSWYSPAACLWYAIVLTLCCQYNVCQYDAASVHEQIMTSVILTMKIIILFYDMFCRLFFIAVFGVLWVPVIISLHSSVTSETCVKHSFSGRTYRRS